MTSAQIQPQASVMLDLVAQSSSSLFEVTQRLHHDSILPNSLCALLTFINQRVSAVLAKRSTFVPQPTKLEKPANPHATKLQSHSRVKSEVRYTCLESWLHLCEIRSVIYFLYVSVFTSEKWEV